MAATLIKTLSGITLSNDTVHCNGNEYSLICNYTYYCLIIRDASMTLPAFFIPNKLPT